MNRPMRKLPVGIQTFSDIITDGYLYVDKTEYIFRLSNSGFQDSLQNRRKLRLGYAYVGGVEGEMKMIPNNEKGKML